MKRGIFLNVFIVTLLLLSVLPFSSEAQTVMPEVLSTSVTGPAGTLNLEIYIPTGTTSPKPAVVFIPGNGEVGTSRAKLYTNGPLNFIKNSGWRPDFIVVGAQPSGTWPNNAFTHTVLSHLVATPSYYIDTNKIYLTGLSAGAEAIDTYIKTQSNPVGLAAVVPMSITYEASCGDFYAQTDYLCGNDLKWATIPAWGFAGSNDSHWEKMRRFFYLMIDAGYNTRWTTYSGGHSGWNAFYNPTYEETINGVSMNIYEWMLQYSRGGTPPPPPTNTPPTANAGTDKTITLPTNSVSLTGSGTDTGGSISSYAWTKVSGGSATIASPSSATTNITGLVQGSYTFRLTVTDNGGLTATDDVVVTVNAASPTNTTPTANAGTDKTITLPTNSVSLTGSATDPEGNSMTYAWTKVSGGSATITSPSSLSTTITGLSQGTYTFWLTVTDSGGLTDADAVTVIVNAEVTPPPPTSGTKTFLIDFGGSPTTSISGWNTISALSTGTTASLVDTIGASTSTSLQITDGFNAGNIAGTTASSLFPSSATSDSFFLGTLGNIIDDNAQLRISGLNSNSLYSFTFYASRLAGDGGNRTSQYVIGSDVVELNATDNINNTVTIYNVVPSNGAVTVSINRKSNAAYGYLGVLKIVESTTSTPPTPDTTAPSTPTNLNGSATSSSAIALSWTASTDNVGVTGYRVYRNTTSSGTYTQIGTSTTPSYSDTGLSAGTTYYYKVAAYDAAGNLSAQTTAKSVTTTTVNPTNTPPTANAGTDKTITLPTNSVSLTGSGTDTGGSISSYAWAKVSGGSATIASPSSATTNITGLVQGSYTFRLTVTDNGGLTATDDVVVTVNAQSGTCSTRRIYLTKTSENSATIPSTALPGDTYIMTAAQNPWSWVNMSNVNGTANCPITLTNEGGQVQMVYGVGVTNGNHVKILGNGSSGTQYGFKIEDNFPDAQGAAVSITEKSSHVEVSNVQINHKEYGFWIKNEASCDTTMNYPNWTLDTISVHDSRITNTDSQGFYMGTTDPNNFDRPIDCNGDGVPESYYTPTRLSNIKIYNNYIDGTGRPGIQLSVGFSGLNEIYNNTVRNTGKQLDDAQGTGISLGGYTRAYVHDNDIKNTLTWGIACLGCSGESRIENNTIDSSGYLGTNTIAWPANIHVDTRSTIPTENTTFIIKNNVLSRQGSASPHNITVARTQPTYSTQNVICGNTANGQPAQVSVASGITWNFSCGGIPSPTNTPPSSNAGTDQSITLPINSVGLAGSGSDIDGTISKYAWTKVSGAGGTISSPSSASTTVTGLTQGSYTFRLTVTDNGGLTATDDVVVTVSPVVATGGGTGTGGTGGGTSSGGGGGGGGGGSSSGSGTVTNSNRSPVVNAGSDVTIKSPTSSVTLSGNATDPDGSIKSYEWKKVSGSSAEIQSLTKSSTKVLGLKVGSYTFRLTATDDKKSSSYDDVNVTVISSTSTASVGYSSSSSSSNTSGSSSTVKVIATELNVRSTPGGSVVGKVQSALTGEIVSTKEEVKDGISWIQITFKNGLKGWVSSKYISKVASTTSSVNMPTTSSGRPSSSLPTTGVNKLSNLQDVKTLQTFLNWVLGSKITPLVVDGKYGPKTTETIRLYQSMNGLTADGLFGKNSSSKANSLISN